MAPNNRHISAKIPLILNLKLFFLSIPHQSASKYRNVFFIDFFTFFEGPSSKVLRIHKDDYVDSAIAISLPIFLQFFWGILQTIYGSIAHQSIFK